MQRSKYPKESSFTSRKLVMPDQINPNGTLFGGVLLSWIDKVAFMTAQRHAELPFVVTANIEQVSFAKPICIGDHVILESSVVYVGRSSMEILVRVEKENGCNVGKEETTRAYMTFVALNSNGKTTPVPQITPETEEEQKEYNKAVLRKRIRHKVNRRMTKMQGGTSGKSLAL